MMIMMRTLLHYGKDQTRGEGVRTRISMEKLNKNKGSILNLFILHVKEFIYFHCLIFNSFEL